MRICVVSQEASVWAALTCSIKKHRAVQRIFCTDPGAVRYADCDLIVFTGFIGTTVVREFEIPGECRQRDIPGAVEYQFIKMLPYEDSSEKTAWEFLLFPRKKRNEPFSVRAAVVSATELSRQLEPLRQRDIRIDQVALTPIFFSKFLFSGAERYGPPRKQEIIRYFSSESVPGFDDFTKECVQNGILDPALQINLFITQYYFSHYHHDCVFYMNSEMNPEPLRPQRCIRLKRLNFALCAILLIVVVTLICRKFSFSYGVYSALATRNQELAQTVQKLQRENQKVNEDIQLLKRYYELNPGNSDLRPVLQEITRKIPSYMWVDSLRFSNGILDLSVKSSKDDINFYNNLKDATHYKLINLRKNRALQEKVEYSVTLKVNQP